MSIPAHLRNNIRLYSHINGFHNIGFITGIYHDSIPNQPPIDDVIWVQQLGFANLNLCMPIRLNPAAGVVLSNDIRPGHPITCRVRLERGFISAPTRSIIPRALTIERPNILNADAEDVFNASLNDLEDKKSQNIPSESFVEGFQVQQTQNNCTVAGFLVAKHIEKTASGRLCLMMLIQQGKSMDDALHVRIYARNPKAQSVLQQYYKKLSLGNPYFFKGNYRVNPKSDESQPANEDGTPAVIKYGYLHVSEIFPVKSGDVPFPFPEWVNEYRASLAGSKPAQAPKPEQVTV